MGALTGTLTYKQYYVQGDLPDGFRDIFTKALRAHAFRDIDLDQGEERALGWVTSQDLLDADFEISKFLIDNYVCMAMREDTIKIPATTLKVYIQKEESVVREQTKRERLSKPERDEIRESVKSRLIRKMLPTIRAYDVVWNLDTRAVWFWTHNRAMCEAFEEFFEKTFSLSLIPHNTYCALSFAGMSDRSLERVLALEPADFVGR